MRPLRHTIDPVSDWPSYTLDDIRLARQRFEQREARLRCQTKPKPPSPLSDLDKSSRQQAILDAVRRKRKTQKL